MAGLDEAMAAPAEVQFEGKTYLLSPLDSLGVQRDYTKYLKHEPVRELRDQADLLDPVEYQEFMAAITRDWAAHVYDYGSPAWSKSLQAKANQKRIILYQLRANHPKEATPELVDRMFDAIYPALVAANAGAPAAEGDDPKA